MPPRYRNDGSHALNYTDSGGPEVAPGAEFTHDIPAAQLASHLRSGFISVVVPVHRGRTVEDVHAHPPGAGVPPDRSSKT